MKNLQYVTGSFPTHTAKVLDRLITRNLKNSQIETIYEKFKSECFKRKKFTIVEKKVFLIDVFFQLRNIPKDNYNYNGLVLEYIDIFGKKIKRSI